MTAFLRAAALILALLGFIGLGIPVMLLARRFHPPLAEKVPVLFHRTMLALIGIKVRLTGCFSAERPQMLVVNHISWTDILVLGGMTPLCFLAKKEVASWPVFGLFARLQGAVFVDRGRRRLIPGVNEQLRLRLAAGDIVVLFAEATTGDGTRLLKFHSPHFNALTEAAGEGIALLQPAALRYTRRGGLPLDRAGRADVAWFGETALLPHLRGLLRGGGIDCEVTLGAPLAVTRGDDRKALAARSRAQIRALHSAAMTHRPADGTLSAPPYSQISEKSLHQSEAPSPRPDPA